MALGLLRGLFAGKEMQDGGLACWWASFVAAAVLTLFEVIWALGWPAFCDDGPEHWAL